MFGIKFTYLKILGVTCMLCFDLAERYTSILKSQHRQNIAILDHHAKVIPITSLYMSAVRMLSIPSSLVRNL